MPLDWHFCTCWLPHVGQLWARTTATHGPLIWLFSDMYAPIDCHLCTCWLPHVGQLSAMSVSVVCQWWATCGPDNYHMWATRGPLRQKKRLPHTCTSGGSHFNWHMWASCGPLVECLLGKSLLVLSCMVHSLFIHLFRPANVTLFFTSLPLLQFPFPWSIEPTTICKLDISETQMLWWMKESGWQQNCTWKCQRHSKKGVNDGMGMWWVYISTL